MGAVPAKVLGQIAKAKASVGGNFIRDGVYTKSIKRFVYKEGFKGHSVIVEFLVDAAAAVPTVDINGVPTTVEPNGVGSSDKIVFNLSAQEMAAGNCKALVCAALGVDEGSVSDADFAEAVDALCNDDPRRIEFQKEVDGSGNPVVTSDGVYKYTNNPVLDDAGKPVFMAVQPGRGRKLKCDTYQYTTKGDPRKNKLPSIITLYRWGHIAQTDEQITARRAELDKAGA